MRRCWWAALWFALLFPSASSATPLVLDFEDLSSEEAVTTQYAGLTFTNAVILTAGISLNEFDFPPRSGVNVMSDNGGAIEIAFAAPVLSFGAFFTYAVPVTLTALDAVHNVLATATSAFSSNLALDPGSAPNEYLEVVIASGIWALSISGDPFGGSFVFDDTTIAPIAKSAVPEPGTLSLLVIGASGIAIRRRLTSASRKSSTSSA